MKQIHKDGTYYFLVIGFMSCATIHFYIVLRIILLFVVYFLSFTRHTEMKLFDLKRNFHRLSYIQIKIFEGREVIPPIYIRILRLKYSNNYLINFA